MISKEIIDYLEEIAPKRLAESWDNVGLQIGNIKKEVKKVLLALDITKEVVAYAVDENIDMIISHHPLFFTNLKSIDFGTYKGSMIEKLIKNDILIYSAHTNLDSSNNGVNDELGRLLDMKNPKILTRTHSDKLYKILVTVPESHAEILRKTLGESGAGAIGDYSNCSFSYKGIGRFKPGENSNPHIGTKGQIERVEEVKIEVVVEEFKLKHVINDMIKNHPYEEVAYDIIELENETNQYGIGRVGNIEKMTIKNLGHKIKEKLDIESLKVYGNLEKKVEKIAVAGGSGADFIKDAYKEKAEVYITGDIKHHDVQLANELGIILIDAGHFPTEKIVMNHLKKYLNKKISSDVEIIISKDDNIAPYKII